MHVSLSFAEACFPDLVGLRAKQPDIHQSSFFLSSRSFAVLLVVLKVSIPFSTMCSIAWSVSLG